MELKEGVKEFFELADKPGKTVSKTEFLAKIMALQSMLEKEVDVPLFIFEEMPQEVRRQCISALLTVYVYSINV